MEKKTNSRQKQATETKKRIYDTAMKLILKNGLDKTSIKEICEKAGVSIGTFYLYYASKEDIILEWQKSRINDFKNMRVLDDASLTWNEKIIALILEWQRKKIYHKNTPIAADPKFFSKYVISENSGFFQTLMSVIIKGQQSGYCRTDFDPKNIAWRIIRFARGMEYDWYLHCMEYDLSEMTSTELDFYLTLFRK